MSPYFLYYNVGGGQMDNIFERLKNPISEVNLNSNKKTKIILSKRS